MKLTIKDGRDHFYTFDTNRILLLTATDEENIRQVEFSTEENGEEVSWTSEVLTGSDGVKYVQVPNEFLNGDYTRLVCYYVALDSNGEYTRQKEIFRIRARQEPQDYYLTYSERVTFASIKALTEQYKATTKQYMDTTEGFKDNAGRSAELASKYAENNEDVAVEPGKYSAKHWSIKAEAAKETAVQKATEAGTSEVNSKTYMESAQSAKQDAETAKNAANTILEQVQSKGTEITNFVATSKTEIETQKNESVNAVKSVYQTDFDELKGDLDNLNSTVFTNLGYANNESLDRNNITITPSDGVNVINGTPNANIGIIINTFTATESMTLTIFASFNAKTNTFMYIKDKSNNSTVVEVYGGESKEFNVESGKTYIVEMYISGYTVWNNETVYCEILSPKIKQGDFANLLKLVPTMETSSNITISDVNNAPVNSIYRFATRTIPSNMPSNMPNPLNCLLYTVRYGTSDTIQYILNLGTYEVLWWRFNTAEWMSVHHDITVGKGSGDWDFSSLYEALLFAYTNENTNITVYDGTYDIIAEMGSNLTSESIGILLGKNMVINFKPHAYVVCNYTGDDSSIKGIFSPFYSGMGDYEINNMKLSCSNVRYCVHDEKSDGADVYSHKYNNCIFYIDNRNNENGLPQCIGGGLGKNGHIEIVGCSFKSETISESGEKAEASYHNSSASGAKSEVIVKDNYFDNGTFRISYYGSSTEKTYAYVSNNRMKYAPYVSQENTSYNNVNVELRAWNNEVIN